MTHHWVSSLPVTDMTLTIFQQYTVAMASREPLLKQVRYQPRTVVSSSTYQFPLQIDLHCTQTINNLLLHTWKIRNFGSSARPRVNNSKLESEKQNKTVFSGDQQLAGIASWWPATSNANGWASLLLRAEQLHSTHPTTWTQSSDGHCQHTEC